VTRFRAFALAAATGLDPRIASAQRDRLSRIRAPTLVLTGDQDLPYLQVVAAAIADAFPTRAGWFFPAADT